ncbi:MAG: helix-turn-helix transcriptional regulator [Lachnospiraceae bacterium]|nr:helix-turn-helix transcriptional regulator [Lachnospiraceae bacterium]
MSDLGNKEIMAKNIRHYMNAFNVTQTEICNTLGIKMPTFSDWVNAKTYPRIDKIELMANYFGISKADLVEEHGSLTKKDERDIEKILDSTREQLLTQQGLMFDGDPATPEAIESILSAMQIGMEMAKKKNKEKYTPKKYKKD